MNKDYNSHMRSEEWEHTRKRLIDEESRCDQCGGTSQLQLHHMTYRNFGDENDEDLQILCKECHEQHHGRRYIRLPPYFTTLVFYEKAAETSKAWLLQLDQGGRKIWIPKSITRNFEYDEEDCGEVQIQMWFISQNELEQYCRIG